MFIICPKCAAKYQIPEGISLQEGQKLKCSACDFVFLKGEETPLVLEQPIIPKITESPTEAFSTPLYTPDDSDITTQSEQNTSLPEAFQPVATPAKSRAYLWFIPIYVLLIIALCMIGWHFRDSLKPSIQEIVPKAKIEKSIPIQEQNTEVKQPVKESLKPVVPKKQETVKSSPMQLKTKQELISVSSPVSEVKPLSVPTKAVQENISEDITGQPVIISDPVLLPPEEELVPLFEAITEPVPIAGKEELAVTQISFKTVPNELGNEQLLVEGSIQNNSSELRSIPPLTVVLFNKDNIILTRKKIHVDTEHLNPEQLLPFYTGITPVPSGVDHVEVQF